MKNNNETDGNIWRNQRNRTIAVKIRLSPEEWQCFVLLYRLLLALVLFAFWTDGNNLELRTLRRIYLRSLRRQLNRHDRMVKVVLINWICTEMLSMDKLKHKPPGGGTTWSRSFGLVLFQIFLITALNSALASSMLPSDLMCNEVRTTANNVALKSTVPSLFNGMFIDTSLY